MTLRTSTRHSGQVLKAPAHTSQTHMWPHGSKRWLFFAVKHTMHSLSWASPAPSPFVVVPHRSFSSSGMSSTTSERRFGRGSRHLYAYTHQTCKYLSAIPYSAVTHSDAHLYTRPSILPYVHTETSIHTHAHTHTYTSCMSSPPPSHLSAILYSAGTRSDRCTSQDARVSRCARIFSSVSMSSSNMV